MPEISTHRIEIAKWFSEFFFVPLLHWMMLSHLYSAATTIGTLVLVAHMTASWHHAKSTGLFRSA